MAAPPTLRFVYIVEPPDYQVMACTLLASIRAHFPPETECIGYCPAEKYPLIHPAVHKAQAMMGAEIRPLQTEGAWDSPYPHGNKILAALAPRRPRPDGFTAFVDSDVLFLEPNRAENLCRPGHVSCSVAASMRWGDETIWPPIYGAFGLPVPAERVQLMRQRRRRVPPYFSAGFVIFPDAPGPGGTFPEVWYDTARRVDRIDGLDNRRPYLDQMSLPVAIRRAGLGWNELPEAQHYIMGGRIRGKALPEDRKIYTVHYRQTYVLRELGLQKRGQALLSAQIGVPYVRRLTPGLPDQITQDMIDRGEIVPQPPPETAAGGV